jgi:hypothetical protein
MLSRQQHDDMRFWITLPLLHQYGMLTAEKNVGDSILRLRGDPTAFDAPAERRWPPTYIRENPDWLWIHRWSSTPRLMAEFTCPDFTAWSEFYGTF